MKKFFSWSIRTHLLLLVLLATLPALAIVVHSGMELRELVFEDSRSKALRMEQNLVYQQERIAENAHQLLLTLAKVPQIRSRDKIACNKLLDTLLKQNPCYANIVVTTPEGVVSASALPVKSFSVADRGYFRDVLKTHDFVIGEYSLSRSTGKSVIHFAYPVTDEKNGRITAVIVASFDLAYYGRLFSLAGLPEGSALALTDNKGIRIYRYPDNEKHCGRPDLPRMLQSMSGRVAEGTFVDKGVDEVERLYGFKRVSMLEKSPYLYLRVGIPADKAIAKADSVFHRNLLLLGLAASLAMVFAWFFGDLIIVHRLDMLVAASLKLGKGELSARTGLSPLGGELGKLAENFDNMAAALESREIERRQAKNSLREQLEIQKALLLSIPAFVYVKNRDFRYIAANTAFAESVGASVEDIIGKTDEDIFPQDMVPLYRKLDREVMENDNPRLNLEEQFVCADGRKLWLSTNKARFHDASGNVVGIVGISLDITERRNAEKALKDSEQRLNLVLEGSNDGFWDWNMATNEVRHSARWAEMLGYRAGEINTGVRDWKRLVHPADMPAVLAIFKDHLAGRMSRCRVEYRIRCKSGEWKWIVDRGKVVEWDQWGRPLRMTGTATDISERKKVELEKQQLADQLRQAQKLEAIGQLTGGIAHDFNNILTAIIGYGHLLLLKIEDGPARGFTEQILASADRAAGLTRSLLAFSRKQVIKPELVDINGIIRKVEKLLTRLIGEDMELHISLTAFPLTVMADTGQVEQVLMNLVTNARDAMPDGGALTIRTNVLEVDKGLLNPCIFEKPVRYACICVSDTGSGMNEETREKIFEPFFTTKEVGKGTGLGLSIVYGIVKQHNGFINVQSEPGKGTTFNIYLPICIQADDKEDQTAHMLMNPLFGTETVLLAEDEDEIRALMRNFLEDNGYTVIEAGNGKEALSCFMEHREKVQLLILDVIMPKMSGKDAYDKIRQIRPDIKVLFNSGYSADILGKKGIIDGDVNFITKPASPVAFLQKVREVLDA